jgi:hypothetical protein
VGATKRNRDLTRQLSAAACTLLGIAPAAGAAGADGNAGLLGLGWQVDSAVLVYQEGEGRVSAVEPVINLKKTFSGNQALNVKFTLDSLTGATPTGATPTNVPQTFTRPSGGGSYTTNPGETPLDDTFRDTRTAVNASWQQPLGRLSLLTVGANYSNEYDFTSMGGNALLSRDFNNRNTTLTFGLSTEQDSIDPVGGVPIPFAAMAPANTTQPRKGSTESKSVLDAMFGVTQVLSPRTLMQVNYSLSLSNGYLNDPYKILSVIDPLTGATVSNVYENRPDSRTKHALYWLIRHRLSRDVVSASYRFFLDDWGVSSHTGELSYRWKPAPRLWFEPHVRYYQQTEADFYRVQLLSGQPIPQEASADYRLAAFNGLTFGLRHGWIFKNESELILELEYYTTTGDSSPSEATGIQRGLDFYPDLKATMLQVQYRFGL